MNLNVLLVDDEYFVLKGMEIMIGEQTEVPVKIVTAMDAVDARSRLASFRPDVIIADVNMPETDGLTMLESLSLEHPCRYIIVSGYEDQNYLKRALKLHVADYLTKPVDKAYLIQRLKDIFEEKNTRISHTWMKIRTLLFSGETFSKTVFSPGELEQFFPFPHLFLCTVSLDSRQAEEAGRRLSAYFESVHPFTRNGLTVFLFNYSAPIRDTEIRSILETLLPLSFGYSSFEETNSAEGGERLFIHFQEALCQGILSVLPVSEGKKQEICGLIASRTLQYAVRVIRFDLSVSEYINTVCDMGLNSQEDTFLLVFAEALAAYLMIAGVRIPDETILQLYHSQLPSAGDNRQALSSFLEKTLNLWYDSFSPVEQAACSSKIMLARQYIDLHYTEDLALEQVAESVSVNPSYLSYIFRKETGITFLQYLTNVRLQAACRILTEQPELSLEDVAARAGYHSASYFHKIFRSRFGVSPRQWRPSAVDEPASVEGQAFRF